MSGETTESISTLPNLLGTTELARSRTSEVALPQIASDGPSPKALGSGSLDTASQGGSSRGETRALTERGVETEVINTPVPADQIPSEVALPSSVLSGCSAAGIPGRTEQATPTEVAASARECLSVTAG